MKAPLHDIALWAGAAAVALAAHVAAGVWLSQIEARPGNGLVAAMPVEIVLEAAPAPDTPPDILPQIMPEAAPLPLADTAPEPAAVPDTTPDPPAPDMPSPDLAAAPPDHAPSPPPPPEVTEPAVAVAVALSPAMPDTAPEPPPDAVVLPQPAGIALPDPVEALPDIQPPPPPPEAEAEPEAKETTDIVVAGPPPARPERIAQRATRPEPAHKAPAPESAAAAPAPAPGAAPAQAASAPPAGEIKSWQAQVQSRVARHMARTRLPSLRGRVQASLHLSVAANGAVTASLASSSGNPDADAALQRQAGGLPALPPPPGGKGVTLILPVVISPR